jgi:putative DNA primase/helicase
MKSQFPPPDARFSDKVSIEQVVPSFNGHNSDAMGQTRNGRPESRCALISRCAADIVPKRIDFLWPGRIAKGKHTAIAGEPGDGKSQLSVFVAATISTGGQWPCDEGRAPVGNVIILNAEDGADDTVVLRLIAAGADRKRVHIVSAVCQEDGKGRRAFNLQADLALLEKKIAEIGDVALVIIDPISSYMGKTDSHKNAEVRGALEPLSEMAERLKVAILSITHFSKTGAGNNSKALHRFIGSIAFVGAPRAAFAVIEDADNEGRMLLLHAKNNMAGKPQGLAYRMVQRIVGKEGEGIVASYIAFDSTPVTVSADEALQASDGGGDRAAVSEAEEFLRDKLSAGPVPAKEAEEDARALMIMPRTLRRARKKLGVISRRESEGRDGRGQWLWSLPSVAGASFLQGGQESCKVAKENVGRLAPSLAPLQGPLPSRAPKAPAGDPWEGMDIPDYLNRTRPCLGSPAISAGPEDDLGDLQ